MHITVVIPAYNEEYTVGEVVRQVMLHVTCYMLHVVVVDDGSTDRTAQAAREAGALVFSHPINRGLGAALSTGIEGALRLHKAKLCTAVQSLAFIVVTMDADGQHNPAEIPRLIEPILKGEAEVVIGSRFLRNPSQPPSPGLLRPRRIRLGRRPPSPRGRGEGEGQRGGGGSYETPVVRRIANVCGNFFTWLLFGIWVSDSQSGFRAFSAEAAAKLRLRTSTMEVSSEIIREIARLKLRLKEVPVTARYTPYSLAKGQGFFRGLQTLWKLVVLRFFR